MQKKSILLIFFITFFSVFIFPNIILAAGIVPDAGKATGNYQINDFLRIAINLSDWILGIVGSLALLAFVAGGVMFIFSGGNSSLVERGRAMIIGAVIGLIVVFTSFMIINFVMKGLGYNYNDGNWSTTSTE